LPPIFTGPVLTKVTTISGHTIEVMGPDEAKYYRAQQRKYLAENKFTAVTDLADLDRLLFLELLIFRWTGWLASGKDYDGLISPSVEDQVRKNLKETAPQISQIKNDLALTKSQRDKEAFESVGQYIVDLKARAKEHGVRREKQLTSALCLTKELFSLVGTFDRSNELERIKIGLESEADIVDWIRGHMRPAFEEIDQHFRATSQKFWVRKL
jgi:hypothetical protein